MVQRLFHTELSYLTQESDRLQWSGGSGAGEGRGERGGGSGGRGEREPYSGLAWAGRLGARWPSPNWPSPNVWGDWGLGDGIYICAPPAIVFRKTTNALVEKKINTQNWMHPSFHLYRE